MNIYENIYIGSFIYQLGLEVGKKGSEHMSSVNLFQQTPTDSKLGDLIPSINGTYLIIEFKRDCIDKKEEEKAQKLIFELNKNENKHLLEISKSCHYIGIGTITNKAEIHFYKYLEYFDEKETEKIDNFIDKFLNPCYSDYDVHKDFHLRKLLYDYYGIGINNYEDFLKYINFLQKIYESDIKNSTGGIIIHRDEKGILSMLPTDNIENLIKNINKSINELKNKKTENYRLS